jgi:hypothetical protein
MAALDFTVASNGRVLVPTVRMLGTELVKAEALLDLSTATGTPTTTATDTIKFMVIPKGAHVLSTGIVVLAADSGGATFGMQDSAGSTNWIAAANGVAVATKGNYKLSRFATDTLPAVGGKLYVADDYLQLLSAVAVTTTAKLIAWAIMANVEYVERDY